MNEHQENCSVCGVQATGTFCENAAMLLCSNIVCYHTAIQIIKEALENGLKGEK